MLKPSIRRLLRLGTLSVLIGALLGLVASFVMPTTYQSSLSFTVNQINKQQTEQYQYDGYYALQASDLFSETIVSWFRTPPFLIEVYEKAGVEPDVASLDSLTGRFKMRKFSSQNLVLTFSEPSRENAEKISGAITTLVEERSGELNQNAELKAIFEVKGSAPVIVKKHLSPLMGAVYGIIAAIVLYLFVATVLSAFVKLDTERKPAE